MRTDNLILALIFLLGFFGKVACQEKPAGNDIKRHLDLVYYKGDDATNSHKLNLFLPANRDKPPILIWIHGGAWAFGGRKFETPLAEKFAQAGIAVAAISYRLSPATWKDPRFDSGIQHPGHITDVARAFRWIYDQAEDYGYDRDNIFVSGYSAGGHLSALLGSDEKYLNNQGLPLSAIRATIPIAGAYDIEAYYDAHYQYNGPDLADAHVKGVFGETKEKMREASVTSYLDETDVPMLVISERESYDYTAILEKKVRLLNLGQYEFFHVRDLNHLDFSSHLSNAPESKYRERIIAFINRHSS